MLLLAGNASYLHVYWQGSKTEFGGVVQEEALEAEVRSSIVSHMVVVHQSVRTFSARFQEQLRRSNYVTPKNYLDFIHNYKHALADNRTTFSGMAARLDGGLQKLIQVSTNFQLQGSDETACIWRFMR